MSSEIIYVKCRGQVVEILSKYLSRIDLFRTAYEQTNEIHFTLLDYSPEEFNLYINYLRDNPFNPLEEKVPMIIQPIFKYLNTDCLEMNKFKEIHEKTVNIVKTFFLKKSYFDIETELKNDPTIEFYNTIDITWNQYNEYIDKLDKFYRSWYKQLNIKFFELKCKHTSSVMVVASSKNKYDESDKIYNSYCDECRPKNIKR